MKKYSIFFLVLSALIFLFSCAETKTNSSKAVGTKGGPCYPNNTCNEGLECFYNVCLDIEVGSDDDAGNTGDTGDSGNSGDTGDTGNSGDTGDTGNSGNSGNTGNSGDTGDTGNSGDTGDTGNSGNTGNTGAGCSDAIIEPVAGYESYFAINLYGVINYQDSSDYPQSVLSKKFKIMIKDVPNTVLNPNFIFLEDDDSNDSILLYTLGDLGGNEQYYNTFIITSIPKQLLEILKDDGINAIDFAPMTQITKIYEFPDDFLKQCIVGISMIETVDEEMFIEGKMQACLENNIDFSADEMLKIGFNVNINTDRNDIADFFSMNSVEELCVCYQNSVETECPEE